MTERKETRKYVFSVEGDTEKWYLDWLGEQINADTNAQYHVLITAAVQKNPLKFVKRLTVNTTPEVVHLCDVEGEIPADLKGFQTVLDRLKDARNAKEIEYDLGYSNLSFELWMILHKDDCRAPLSTKNQYLSRINRLFGQSFESLDQYKKKDNFDKCLNQLSLQDVIQAIHRSQKLMKEKEETGSKLSEYKGYRYYTDNPALTIFQAIDKILRECGLL